MNEAKSRRVTRKVRWVRDDLKQRGCKRCGYTDSSAALTHHGGGRNPLQLAYDDYGWAKIRRFADRAEVYCRNCQAILEDELRKARVLA